MKKVIFYGVIFILCSSCEKKSTNDKKEDIPVERKVVRFANEDLVKVYFRWSEEKEILTISDIRSYLGDGEVVTGEIDRFGTNSATWFGEGKRQMFVRFDIQSGRIASISLVDSY